MAVLHQRTIFDKQIDLAQRLRIISIVDREDWKVASEQAGHLISGITLSIKEKENQKAASPALRPSLSKTFLVSKPRNKPSPRVTSPTARPNAIPLPYKLSLQAFRTNRSTKVQTEVGIWYFSGDVKQGDYFHFRTDAIFDMMKEGCGHIPHHFDVVVRVVSKKSLRAEFAIVETGVLDLGLNVYENVSKEILALYSDYFNAFFYGGFSESASDAPCKVRPVNGEKQQDFETAMKLLLHFVFCKSMALVTPKNAHLLIDIADRLQFCKSITKRVDAHLAKLIPVTEDKRTLDETLILAETYVLPRTKYTIMQQYNTTHDLGELFDRQKDRLSSDILARVFMSYRRTVQEAFYRGSSHLYFNFAAGRVIVQLNRVALPNTTTKALDACTGTDEFYWDHKRRLVSREPKTGLYCCEYAEKNTVPDGAWALILRNMGNMGPRIVLTKTRPAESHSPVYLGFVVQGDNILAQASSSMSSCTSSGVQMLTSS